MDKAWSSRLVLVDYCIRDHSIQGITGPKFLHSINDFCSPP